MAGLHANWPLSILNNSKYDSGFFFAFTYFMHRRTYTARQFCGGYRLETLINAITFVSFSIIQPSSAISKKNHQCWYSLWIWVVFETFVVSIQRILFMKRCRSTRNYNIPIFHMDCMQLSYLDDRLKLTILWEISDWIPLVYNILLKIAIRWKIFL